MDAAFQGTFDIVTEVAIILVICFPGCWLAKRRLRNASLKRLFLGLALPSWILTVVLFPPLYLVGIEFNPLNPIVVLPLSGIFAAWWVRRRDGGHSSAPRGDVVPASRAFGNARSRPDA